MAYRTYRSEPRQMHDALTEWMAAGGFDRPRLWQSLQEALQTAVPAEWRSHAYLCGVSGNEACVAVDSAALLAELKGFYTSRLRATFQAAAPQQGLRRIRFVLVHPPQPAS